MTLGPLGLLALRASAVAIRGDAPERGRDDGYPHLRVLEQPCEPARWGPRRQPGPRDRRQVDRGPRDARPGISGQSMSGTSDAIHAMIGPRIHASNRATRGPRTSTLTAHPLLPSPPRIGYSTRLSGDESIAAYRCAAIEPTGASKAVTPPSSRSWTSMTYPRTGLTLTSTRGFSVAWVCSVKCPSGVERMRRILTLPMLRRRANTTPSRMSTSPGRAHSSSRPRRVRNFSFRPGERGRRSPARRRVLPRARLAPAGVTTGAPVEDSLTPCPSSPTGDAPVPSSSRPGSGAPGVNPGSTVRSSSADPA